MIGAGVVGEQETQRLPRQHGFVDGCDLVRQRVDQRRVHREHRIEEMGEANTVSLRDEPKERAVAVETPRPSRLDDLESRFVVPVKNLLRNAPVRPTIDESQRVRPMPGHTDDRDQGVRQDAPDGGVGLEVFEGQRASCLSRS
jgi:hypothetical protein